MYNMSLDISVFDLHQFEKKEIYDFVPTFLQDTDFVQFSKQTKLQEYIPTLNKDGCSSRFQNNQLYCRCNHLSLFSAKLSYVTKYASLLSRMKDINTSVDFKIKRTFFQTIAFQILFPMVCVHFGLILLCYVKYSKDIEFRRRTILEYIKFLLLWRKRKDVFEGDITSLKEKIEEMKLKRIAYFQSVSKERVLEKGEQYIEHAIIDGQKNLEFPAFYPKETVHMQKDPQDWGEEEKELEDKELVQQHLQYMHYLQHKRFDEFDDPEVYDMDGADGDLKKLREQKIKLLEEYKPTGDVNFDRQVQSELRAEIKKLDRKTGLEARDVQQIKEGRQYQFKMAGKKFQAKEADVVVTKVKDLNYIKDDAKLEEEKEKLKNEIDAIMKKYASPITKEKIEPEVAEFLKNILPKELLTRDMKDLMNRWPKTLDVIYEMHMFSTNKILKDKENLTKFMSSWRIIFLTNPVTNIFFKDYSFITPPIIRINYMFATFFCHFLMNALSFLFLSQERYERDVSQF